VFYRQTRFFEKNKRYSSKLTELGTDIKSLYDSNLYKLSIVYGKTFFEARFESTDGKMKLIITQEGTVVESQ